MILLARLRTTALLLAAALLSLGILGSSEAAASHSQQTIFDATSSLIYADGKDRKQRLNELSSLGVDTIRIVLPWRSFVPGGGKGKRPEGFHAADPREYPRGIFDGLDGTVRGAGARGMRILLTPAAPIPDWASASGSSAVANPEPAEFRRFVTALGARYGGAYHVDQGKTCGAGSLGCVPHAPSPALPRIGFWSVYNEPNLDLFLAPQFARGRPYAAKLYRRLFLAARAGLEATGHGDDTVLIGETAPSGGRASSDPLDFLRGVLCLDSSFHKRGRCAPLEASGWAHHPYNPGVAPFEQSSNPNLIGLQNISRLTAALRSAGQSGASARTLPVYFTEFGVQSYPDRALGVGLARQAAYLAIAEFIGWNDAGVRSYAQYLLRDDPASYQFSFTTGLRLADGRAKPSLRSFPMTLLAKRLGRDRVRLWGHVRPGEGPYRVEIRYRMRKGPSHRLRTVGTNRLGYFSFTSPYRAGRRWSASTELPGGRRLEGPYLHAYTF